ncbi:rho GTPase-activating protein 5-like [Macadamia integrifolia]|uniref:rho GTPase-activating protein 5-like n=1 Tax=Macadamia integrifolia TaxID=60698 RepID=UPI001C501C35|nr:rho GTPase-activating protein 5-like [Macadamia integrifolia]XP_042513793.1 rho GTPase-activating protein 5-like [Macadamia integrifolia]
MTEILCSPSHFPSSPSSLSCLPTRNGSSQSTLSRSRSRSRSHSRTQSLISNSTSSPVVEVEANQVYCSNEEEEEEGDQLSLLALLVTVFRKPLVACRTTGREELCSMEIGWPTNVRHVAHVTFDRFDGFLGLPDEFEPEVPRRSPSASQNVFGVSTESMQMSFDSRGNSVPTILLLMQKRLYAQGGLQAEGIFRIAADNSQEEYVRDQLNRGIVPDGIDVHCLAGLIKAWFRQLPTGVLDSLSTEQVMQCQSEEEFAQLVRLLPPTEAALLDWAINLMADVVHEEHLNKMNAQNVATVFAPNMTQMVDPLTALMYAVQVMNLLKTLIIKTLKERGDSVVETDSDSHLEPSDENGHQSPSQLCLGGPNSLKEDTQNIFSDDEPDFATPPDSPEEDSRTNGGVCSLQTTVDKFTPDRNGSSVDCNCEVPGQLEWTNKQETGEFNDLKAGLQAITCKKVTVDSSASSFRKGSIRLNEKSKGMSIISHINSMTERIEAWR